MAILMNPSYFASPAVLASAATATLQSPHISLPVVMREMNQIARRMQEIDEIRDRGNDLKAALDQFEDDLDDGLKPYRKIAEIIGGIPPELFAKIPEGQGWFGPAGIHTPPSVAIQKVRRAIDPKAAKKGIFPRIDDPAARVPVSNPAPEQQLAHRNLTIACQKYLSGKMTPEQLAMMPVHLQGILSGEIGAPVESRERAVAYVAASPEQAEAYAVEVLTQALLNNQMGADLVTIVPKFDVLKPRVAPKEVKTAPRVRGDTTAMADQLYEIRMKHADAFQGLAESNPDAYGVKALKNLEGIAGVLKTLREIADPKAQIEYIVMAEESGMIPRGTVASGKDCGEIEVAEVADGPAVPRWRDPIDDYLLGTDFVKMAADIGDSSDGPDFEKRVDRFVSHLTDKGEWTSSRQESIRLVKETMTTDRKGARRAFIRMKMSLLNPVLEILEGANLDQMRRLASCVEDFLEREHLDQAEALCDFGRQWANATDRMLDRIQNCVEELIKIGERTAATDFERAALSLLRSGRREELQNSLRWVQEQTEGKQQRIRTRIDAFTKRVEGTLTVIVESARSIAALPPSSERTEAAARVPAVNDLLTKKDGPSGPDAARQMLRAMNIPVPGDPDVPSLETAKPVPLIGVRSEDEGPGSEPNAGGNI